MSKNHSIQIFVLFFLVMIIGQPLFPVFLLGDAADQRVSTSLVAKPFLNTNGLKPGQVNLTNLSPDDEQITDVFVPPADFSSLSSGTPDDSQISRSDNKNPVSLGNTSFLPDFDTFPDTLTDRDDQERQGPGTSARRNTSVITNISYEYTRDVVQMDLTGLSVTDQGVLTIPDDHYEIGDILVDNANKVALKIIGNRRGGGRIVRQAEMAEIFEKFTVPSTSVRLQDGNYFINPDLENYVVNVDKSNSGQNSGLIVTNAGGGSGSKSDREIVNDKIWKKFHFETPTIVAANDGDGGTVTVTLQGEIGIGADMIFDYDLFDGYNVGFSGAEEIKLKAKVNGDIKKRVYILLYGIDVPLEGVGTIEAGLFLVINVNGEFSIVFEVEEGSWFETGVSGGTFFGAPTSIHPYQKSGSYAGSAFDPDGYIRVDALIAIHVQISVLGCDVLMGEFGAGVSGYAEYVGGGDRIAFGIAFIIECRFKILDMGGKNLLDGCSWMIFSSEKNRPPTYTFYTSDFDAYRDTIMCRVTSTEKMNTEYDPTTVEDPFSTKVPYSGPVHMDYKTHDGDIIPIDTTSDSNGFFTYNFLEEKNIDVVKGDSLDISVPDSSHTGYLESSFPFKRVILTQAEFFEDWASGYVEPAAPLSIPGVLQVTDPNNLEHYEGPIFIVATRNGDQNVHQVCDNQESFNLQIPDLIVTPGSLVQAVASKDGFDVYSDIREADNPIEFKKWNIPHYETTNEDDTRYPVINHVEQHFFTLNTNPKGTRACTEPVHLTVKLGRLTPEQWVFEMNLKEKLVCNSLPDNLQTGFYERNPKISLPVSLYTFDIDSELKNEWVTTNGDNALSAGTNLYWAYKVDDLPPASEGVPEVIDLSSVKRMKPFSDRVSQVPPVSDSLGDSVGLHLPPPDMYDALTRYKNPIVGDVIVDDEVLLTEPVYTVISPQAIQNMALQDDLVRLQTDATYQYEGAEFAATYLYNSTSGRCIGGNTVSKESQVQHIIDLIQKHDSQGLWYDWNKFRINPDKGDMILAPGLSDKKLVTAGFDKIDIGINKPVVVAEDRLTS